MGDALAAPPAARPPVAAIPWRGILGAMSALLVGIGFARFAYAPLLPVLISRGWFAPGAAAYLGAANLLGYLGGALAARPVAARLPVRSVVRGAMLLSALSLAACCTKLPFPWFFAWRMLAGVTGGMLMVLAPSAVMAHVPPERRGLASGLILTGVALGIAASGTLVPLLLRWGLPAAWLGLAAVSLLLTLLAWRSWPASAPVPAVPVGGTPTRFGVVAVSYGLCAVAMVPHMVFLADFVARGLGRGIDAGAVAWVLYGVGALVGAVMAGRMADWVGPAATMRTIMAVEGAALVVLLVTDSAPAIAVSIVFAGMTAPAISAVMLGRVAQMAGGHPAVRQRGWTQATVAWAVGQAGGAYAMAWLYGSSGEYALLFAAALAALGAAAGVEVLLALQPARTVSLAQEDAPSPLT